MMEFTFCMIIITLMIYSMMMIFRWMGVDLAERRIAHDSALTQPVGASSDGPGAYTIDKVYTQSPAKQIDTYFYKPIKMNAISDKL